MGGHFIVRVVNWIINFDKILSARIVQELT